MNLTRENDENFDQCEQLSETIDCSNSLFSITDHEQSEINPTTQQQICRVSLSSTGTSVAQLIKETLSLNWKQALVVRKVLDHAIQ